MECNSYLESSHLTIYSLTTLKRIYFFAEMLDAVMNGADGYNTFAMIIRKFMEGWMLSVGILLRTRISHIKQRQLVIPIEISDVRLSCLAVINSSVDIIEIMKYL